MHDATKLVLGSTRSNVKDVASFAVDPASFPAGLCVSLASTGLPSLLKSAGMRYGVSLGKSLADHKKTDVCQAGLRVPVLASLKRSTGTITVTNVSNLTTGTPDTLTIGGTAFAFQSGAATPGDATIQATGTTSQTATNIAAQINAHATASTKVYAVANAAVVTLYSVVEGAGTGNDVAVSYTDNSSAGLTLGGLTGGKLAGGSDTITDIAYINVGEKMYINDTTGKADIAMTGFSTVSDAVYVSTEMTGVDESGASVAAVLVDMQGGL